jgi:hypothetical protein
MDKRFGYNVKVLIDKLFPCHVFKTIITEHEGEEFYTCDRCIDLTKLEVVGNRFDNPELLTLDEM